MRLNVTSRHITLFTVGAYCLFALLSVSADAQSASLRTRLHTQQIDVRGSQQSFTDYLTIIIRKLECSLVVDDESQVTQVDLDLHGSIEQVLDAVASAFDYTWSLNRHNVIVMTKQFHNPVSYPQMNSGEMRQMAQDMLAILNDIRTEAQFGGAQSPLKALYESFTPTQLSEIQMGRSLIARDLQPSQRNLVEQSIISNSYGDFRSTWQILLTELNEMPRSLLRLTEPFFPIKSPLGQNTPAQKELSYVWRDREKSEHVIPLSTNASGLIRMLPPRTGNPPPKQEKQKDQQKEKL